MRRILLVSAFLLGSAALALGCSGDDSSTDGGTSDSGGGNDSGGNDSGTVDSGGGDSGMVDSGGGDSGTTDSGAQDAGYDGGTVNACTTFTVKTKPNDTRQITFPNGASPAQYSPACLEIKSGQSVTWSGSFSNHPLEPGGGTSNSPIQVTSNGSTVTFTFPNAGTYGFNCGIHPGIMFGAVHVIP